MVLVMACHSILWAKLCSMHFGQLTSLSIIHISVMVGEEPMQHPHHIRYLSVKVFLYGLSWSSILALHPFKTECLKVFDQIAFMGHNKRTENLNIRIPYSISCSGYQEEVVFPVFVNYHQTWAACTSPHC